MLSFFERTNPAIKSGSGPEKREGERTMPNTRLTARIFLLAGISTVTLSAAPALAQAASEPASGTSASQTPNAENAYSDEIVVTARKRVESLNDVPISIAVVSGEKVARYGNTRLESVAQSVPNVYIDKVPSNPRIAIRGFGTVSSQISFEQSVGLSIDNVYFSRPWWFEVGLFDIDRIEVLRGPQGVYFGKNTTAGLINIRTRGPGDTLEGYVRAGYEFKYREKRVEGAVGGPLSDTFAARLAVQYRNSDGWMRNIMLGKREPATDAILGRLTLSWRPVDDLQIVYKGQAGRVTVDGKQEENECTPAFAATLKAQGFKEDCVINGIRTGGNTFPEGVLDYDHDRTRIRSFSHSLSIDWQLGSFTLSSVTGYQSIKMDLDFDFDFNDRALLQGYRPDYAKAFSQEVRLTTPRELPVSAVVGLYYEKNKITTPHAVSEFANIGSRASEARQNGQAWAVFGEATWNITDDLRLVGGGRYTHESKKIFEQSNLGPVGDPFQGQDPSANPFLVPTPPALTAIGQTPILFRGKRSFNNFSPSIVGQFDIARDVMAYASYKQGFKSGGYDIRFAKQAFAFGPVVPALEIDPEKVKTIEAGLKGAFLDRRLNLSLALFRNKYSDLQVSVFDPVILAAYSQNAAKATTQGFELEGTLNATRDLRLNAAVGYTDSKYDFFPNASCYTGQTLAQGCVSGTQNLKGASLPIASRWSGSAGFDWSHDFGGFVLAAGGQASYRSALWLTGDNDPNQRQKGYWLVDGRIAISDSRELWTLALIGRNLFNKTYVNGSVAVSFAPAGNYTRTIGDPRTVQIEVTRKF
jgi:outer membrane receptor protein involved in Fe transport